MQITDVRNNKRDSGMAWHGVNGMKSQCARRLQTRNHLPSVIDMRSKLLNWDNIARSLSIFGHECISGMG